MPNSSIASWAALRSEAPTTLGPPFCVNGRIRPTRTGPVPRTSPTGRGRRAAATGPAASAPRRFRGWAGRDRWGRNPRAPERSSRRPLEPFVERVRSLRASMRRLSASRPPKPGVKQANRLMTHFTLRRSRRRRLPYARSPHLLRQLWLFHSLVLRECRKRTRDARAGRSPRGSGRRWRRAAWMKQRRRRARSGRAASRRWARASRPRRSRRGSMSWRRRSAISPTSRCGRWRRWRRPTPILAEDTRVSRRLLERYEIATPLVAYHEHNAAKARPRILARLAEGEALALISDAGTPLISDPGYKLAAEAVAAGIAVVQRARPFGGAGGADSAALPTDRFFFEGFLPPKAAARRERINALAGDSCDAAVLRGAQPARRRARRPRRRTRPAARGGRARTHQALRRDAPRNSRGTGRPLRRRGAAQGRDRRRRRPAAGGAGGSTRTRSTARSSKRSARCRSRTPPPRSPRKSACRAAKSTRARCFSPARGADGRAAGRGAAARLSLRPARRANRRAADEAEGLSRAGAPIRRLAAAKSISSSSAAGRSPSSRSRRATISTPPRARSSEAKRRRISRAARVWLARNPWAAGATLRGDAVFVAPRRLPRHLGAAYRLDIN